MLNTVVAFYSQINIIYKPHKYLKHKWNTLFLNAKQFVNLDNAAPAGLKAALLMASACIVFHLFLRISLAD